MFVPVALTVSAITACLRGAQAHPSSYAEWAADSAIRRGQGHGITNGAPLVSYEDGEFQWALRQLYERTGNSTYYDYIQSGVDNVVFPNGTVGGQYR